MTPSDYVTSIVDPTIAEFEAEPTSVRRAYQACAATWHFADCVKEATSLELHKIRADLEAKCGTFNMIGDLANLSKHFRLDPRRNRVLITLSDIHVGPAAAFTDGSYWSDGTAWTDSPDVVRAAKGGQPVDVLHCVRLARAAIRQFLCSIPSL
jgi:hypothetical protein